MRKITAKKDDKKNAKIAVGGIFLVVIMLFSTVGYSFMSMDRDNGSSSSSFNYNGFVFNENNGYFFTNVNGYTFMIKTDPRNIGDGISNESLRGLNYYNQIPLYYNSEDVLASSEITNNLRQIVLRMPEACIEGFSSCDISKDLPMKNCSKDSAIIIKIANKSEINQIENCVIISGAEENILEVTDEFILKTLGILA